MHFHLCYVSWVWFESILLCLLNLCRLCYVLWISVESVMRLCIEFISSLLNCVEFVLIWLWMSNIGFPFIWICINMALNVLCMEQVQQDTKLKPWTYECMWHKKPRHKAGMFVLWESRTCFRWWSQLYLDSDSSLAIAGGAISLRV